MNIDCRADLCFKNKFRQQGKTDNIMKISQDIHDEINEADALQTSFH